MSLSNFDFEKFIHDLKFKLLKSFTWDLNKLPAQILLSRKRGSEDEWKIEAYALRTNEVYKFSIDSSEDKDFQIVTITNNNHE